MDGFDEKIGKLLSNPEAVSKMMELAKNFGMDGDGDSGGGRAAVPAMDESSGQAEALPPGLTPAAAPDLTGLLSKIDPAMLGGIVRLAGEYGRSDDRRITFLDAIRPYVRAERRSKLDRAAEIVRLAKLAKHGLGILGGGDGVV